MLTKNKLLGGHPRAMENIGPLYIEKRGGKINLRNAAG